MMISHSRIVRRRADGLVAASEVCARLHNLGVCKVSLNCRAGFMQILQARTHSPEVELLIPLSL